MRVDKYLWAVRIFKTRSQATNACKNRKIWVEGVPVKPSKDIDAGDIIQVKRNPIVYAYQVIEPIQKRVSAKLAPEYVKDVTSEEERKKREEIRKVQKLDRPKGYGRPTKKERRQLDRFKRKGLIN